MVHRTPFFLPLLYPTLTWRMPAENNDLYLTFDDGPVPGPTDFVVETLRSFNAKATFFCIGDNVRKHPDVFGRAVADGHTVANHTFNHLNGWRTKTTDYIANTKKCAAELHTQHGTGSASTPALFRPPYGRITRKQIGALREFRIIMWDVLSVDYDKSLKADKCLRNTIAATRPGSIIVFHDSYKAEKNLTHALPRFLEHFSSQGFQFKSLA